MEQFASASGGSTIYQAARDLYVYGSSAPAPGLATLVVPEEVAHAVRGRDELLADLAGALRPGGQVVVLHGNGGHGKTTVAARFARLAGVEVWWVDAGSATKVAESLREVALRAGADERAVRDAWAGSGSAPEVLWRALDARATPWLLVFDDADDPHVLAPDGERVATGRGWLRTPRPSGMVLITSRDGRRAEWGDRTFLPVGVLDGADAAAVLLDLAPAAGDETAARELADRLGGLPLALRLTGHYLRATSEAVRLPGATGPRTFAEYARALASGVEPPGHETLARTWDLSLDLLVKRGQPPARPLLRLLSAFAPAPIPVEVLDAAVLGRTDVFAGIDAARLTALVEALRDFGLVQHQAGALVLHPLVREANAREAARYDDVVRDLLIEVALDLDPEDHGSWPLWHALLPHFTRLPESATAVHAATIYFCQAAGLYAEAERVNRRVLAEHVSRLGPEHPHTLMLRSLLASQLKQRGEVGTADAELRAVLEAQERTLGPDHVLTADTRHRLGRTTEEFAPGEEELRAELARRTRLLGPDHLDTQAVWTEWAGYLSLQGRHLESLVEWRDLIESRRRLLGDEHPFTLATWQEIGLALLRSGDYTGAEPQLRGLLSVCLRVLGPEHPTTLIARSSLALAFAAQGQLQLAENEYYYVVTVSERVLGPDHPSTRSARESLDRVRLDRAGR